MTQTLKNALTPMPETLRMSLNSLGIHVLEDAKVQDAGVKCFLLPLLLDEPGQLFGHAARHLTVPERKTHSQSTLVHTTWKCYCTDNFSTQPVHACTHNMKMLLYRQFLHTASPRLYTHGNATVQFLHTASPCLYTHGNARVQTISPHSQSTLVHKTWKCYSTISPHS